MRNNKEINMSTKDILEKYKSTLTKEEQEAISILENNTIYQELNKAGIDEIVFGECMIETTKEGIRHIPVNSKEYNDIILRNGKQ
jgi:hypothetical protein